MYLVGEVHGLINTVYLKNLVRESILYKYAFKRPFGTEDHHVKQSKPGSEGKDHMFPSHVGARPIR
jgi:hypothetical protein